MDPSQSTATLRLLPQPRPLFDDFFLSTGRRQTEQGKDMGMGAQTMSSARRQRWTGHLRGQPWLSRQNAAALLDLRMMPSPRIPARAEPETSWRYTFFRHESIQCSGGGSSASVAQIHTFGDPTFDKEGLLTFRVTRRCAKCRRAKRNHDRCEVFGMRMVVRQGEVPPRFLPLDTREERINYLEHCVDRGLLPQPPYCADYHRLRLNAVSNLPTGAPANTADLDAGTDGELGVSCGPSVRPASHETEGTERHVRRRVEVVLPGGRPRYPSPMRNPSPFYVESSPEVEEPAEPEIPDALYRCSRSPPAYPLGPKEECPVKQEDTQQEFIVIDWAVKVEDGQFDCLQQEIARLRQSLEDERARNLELERALMTSRASVQSMKDAQERTSRHHEKQTKVIDLLVLRISDLRAAIAAGAPELDSSDPIDRGVPASLVWLEDAHKRRVVGTGVERRAQPSCG